jgi:hypothetical protein
MAKTAARRPAKAPKKKGGIRPVFLAAGLGLGWFVEFQDISNANSDMVMWNYLVTLGARLLADFVGAWVLVAGLQLAIVLVKLGLTYLRVAWAQESGK